MLNTGFTGHSPLGGYNLHRTDDIAKHNDPSLSVGIQVIMLLQRPPSTFSNINDGIEVFGGAPGTKQEVTNIEGASTENSSPGQT